MSNTADPFIEKQWKMWNATKPFDNLREISEDELRQNIIDELVFVSKMDVQEYTLYQKWKQIQQKYPTIQKETLYGQSVRLVNSHQQKVIENTKKNIWVPDSGDDYRTLEPILVCSNGSKELSETFTCLRDFTTTQKNNANIGRRLNYIVVDKNTNKYLGIITIGSDFLDMTPRDEYIGWSRDQKTTQRMINHTAIGAVIVPTQPLGYNYVGGKLLSLLCLSDTVQEQWEKTYGDVLVGLTTTSLYGQSKNRGLSQYDNLKHWKKMGYTSGSISYENEQPTIDIMIEWLLQNHPRKYFEWYQAKCENGQRYKRDIRNRSLSFIHSCFSIDKDLLKSNHKRGIYFSPLYKNTNQFLQKQIESNDLVKAFDTSNQYLSGLWKEKYAAHRITVLTKNKRVSNNILFYDDMIYSTWLSTKEKYISQVGR